MKCECGGQLLHSTGDETITTNDGLQTFRRENVYLLCPDCFRLYSQGRLVRNETHGVELADAEAASYLSMLSEEGVEA